MARAYCKGAAGGEMKDRRIPEIGLLNPVRKNNPRLTTKGTGQGESPLILYGRFGSAA
jgi:hypothetical protein